MQILKKAILLFFTLLPCLVFSQPGEDNLLASPSNAGCGLDGVIRLARKNPAFRNREAIMNREIINTPVVLDAQVTLPVVFHIISDDTTVVDDQVILNALKDLNDAFGKTGNYATGNGVDTKIRFCLARTDPDGGITNGITRSTSYFSNDLNRSIEDERLKKLVYWDPQQYINIWFVKNIQDENFVQFSCALTNGSQWKRIGTLGYAPMPGMPLDSADGIVVSEFGPVLAHEMGHYLGLYHTFEGGCNNSDCTTTGDRVCDTPPDGSYYPSSCSDPANTCHTDTLSNYSNGYFRQDVPDQVANFMDYNNWDCANMFTNGQAVRMKAAIAAFRTGLLAGKCNPPCNDNILASFTKTPLYPLPGETVTFTNNSTGAGSYQWFLNDSLVASGTNFKFTFRDTGAYKITLKAYNNPNCFASQSDKVIINCGVAARFFADKQQIASKQGFILDSIFFKNTSYNASAFKWFVSNDAGMAETMVSTARDLTYTFLQPGNYYIKLVASNGACTDTTLYFQVPVLDPTPDVRPVIYEAQCFNQTKVKLVFGICNNGYTPLAPGVPVAFYDADPRLPGAKKLGATFLLPDSLRGGCCSQQYTVIIDAARAGLNQIYVSFNDKGNLVPVKYPGSNVIEKDYTNNVVAEKFFRYQVAIQPSSATVMPGDSLQLSVTASPAGIQSSYKWSPAQFLTCNNCANPFVVPDSTRTFSVQATSEFGCFDTASVLIKVPPVYDYKLSIDNITCTADNDSLLVDFTVYNTYKKPLLPKGLPVSFYNKDPVAGIASLLQPLFKLPGSSNQPQQSFKTKIKAVRSGSVYGVVNDLGLSFPLKLPNSSFAEINYANNVASKAYEALTVTASNAGPVCENDSIRLKASSNLAGAAFTWSGPNNFTSTAQDPSFRSGSMNNAGVYSVIASVNGCSTASASTTVVLHESPVTEASANQPVCETGTLRLNASGPSANKYEWAGPNGFTSNQQGPSFNGVSAASAGTYTVVATSPDRCISQPSAVQVRINPKPVADFSAPDICLPATTVTFKNESSVSGSSITSFAWVFGDPQTGAANKDSVANPTHVFSAPGKFQVSLTVTAGNGCTASVSKSYAGIHEQPVARFQTDHAKGICAGEEISFFDNSNADNGTITTWTWLAGDGSPSVSYNDGSTPFKHTYSQPGNYKMTLAVKNDFGCANQNEWPVEVFSLPVVDAGPDQFILLGRSTQLNASVSQDVVSLIWTPQTYLSNANIPNPAVNGPAFDIRYAISVSNANNCKATDTVQVKLLRTIQVPNVFSPNGDGINDVWNVRFLADYPGCIVDIFDRYGKQVFHSVGYNKPWDGTRGGTPIPVGVYYYIITPKNGAPTVNGSVTVLR